MFKDDWTEKYVFILCFKVKTDSSVSSVQRLWLTLTLVKSAYLCPCLSFIHNNQVITNGYKLWKQLIYK